jgi:hypothetical protein
MASPLFALFFATLSSTPPMETAATAVMAFSVEMSIAMATATASTSIEAGWDVVDKMTSPLFALFLATLTSTPPTEMAMTAVMTFSVEISAAAAAVAASTSVEVGWDVVVVALCLPREEAGGCFPCFFGESPLVPAATLPDLVQVLRMMVQSEPRGNEPGCWMIFEIDVTLRRGVILMEFAENGIGGRFFDTNFYVGAWERFDS